MVKTAVGLLALTLAFVEAGDRGLDRSFDGAELLRELQSLQGVSVQFYSVTGKSRAEIRANLDQHGPKDDHGRSRDAHTLWRIDWSWPRDPSGRPDFRATTTTFSANVILPDWIEKPSAPASLRNEWNSYLSALIRHEMEHVRHAFEGHPRVASAVRDAAAENSTLTTTKANKVAGSVIAAIRARDTNLDADSKHGQRDGVRF